MNSPAPVAIAPEHALSAVPAWRRLGVVPGAMLGLFAGFNGLFFATLPFFMLPIGREFGWGRADVSLAAVLSMLGVSLASPLMGRLFDRHGLVPVLGTSVTLLSAALWAFGQLPRSLPICAGLAFALGVLGSATTMAGYLAVLPRWFDRRLGLALGLAGLGLGLGVILNGWLATALIARLGWRDAYAALAVLSAVVGWMGVLLVAAPGMPVATAGPACGPAVAQGPGEHWSQALRSLAFWLLLVTTLLLPLAVLGSAVHAPALYADRGMTPQQAALGASLAGVGALVARIAVGALLDRVQAPRVAMGVFALAACGLVLSAQAQTLPMLLASSLMAGLAIGAEGDLMPYMVRRCFGLRSFGAIFGTVFAAYALGGVLGPALYGLAFDRLGGYVEVMLVAAAACLLCALAMLPFPAYRYGPQAPASPAP